MAAGGVHWQNGVAEKAIRDLKESARTILLHAFDRWPGAITTYLWPQALRHAATLRNNAPFKHEDRSPLELFTSSEILLKCFKAGSFSWSQSYEFVSSSS